MPKTSTNDVVNALTHCIVNKKTDEIAQYLSKYPEMKTNSDLHRLIKCSAYRSVVQLFFANDEEASLAGISTIVSDSDSDFSDTDSDFDTCSDSDSDFNADTGVADFFDQFLAPTPLIRDKVQAIAADPALYKHQYQRNFELYLRSFYTVYIHEVNQHAKDAGYEQAFHAIRTSYRELVQINNDVVRFVEWWQKDGIRQCDKCFGALSAHPANYYRWYNWIVSQDILRIAANYSNFLPLGDASLLRKAPLLKEKLDSNPGLNELGFIAWWEKEGKQIFFETIIMKADPQFGSSIESSSSRSVPASQRLYYNGYISFFTMRMPSLTIDFESGEHLEIKRIIEDWKSRSIPTNFNLFTHVARHLQKPALALKMLNAGVLNSRGKLTIPFSASPESNSRPSHKHILERNLDETEGNERVKRHCN